MPASSAPAAGHTAGDLNPRVWPASAHRDEAGRLVVGGVDVQTLRERYGTPLYVFDEGEVRTHARATREAFDAACARHGVHARVYYAGKAFLSAAVIRWVRDAGLHVDVCTGGELEIALAAGVDAADIGFHGNNKSVPELRRAVEVGVGCVIVDSLSEIERLAAVAAERDVVQPVLVRVATGVHAQTHEFLATAHEDQKFGFPLTAAEDVAARVRSHPSLRLLGLHCHIGSQIFGVAGFVESAERLVAVHARLLAEGPVPLMNLGGGFGIAYTADDDPMPAAELAAGIVDAVAAACARRGIPMPDLAFEPGRSIVGQAGVTLYEVGTVKAVRTHDVDEGSRLYVSVDGGMSDNPRPALYGADYTAGLASRVSDAPATLARVVGKHCETGDIVVEHGMLPSDVAPGDLVAVAATGAYCFALSSNYNAVARPPVVAVTAGESRVIVRGETIDDILARDVDLGPEGKA